MFGETQERATLLICDLAKIGSAVWKEESRGKGPAGFWVTLNTLGVDFTIKEPSMNF